MTYQVDATTLLGTVSQSAQWAVSSDGRLQRCITDDPICSLSMQHMTGSIPLAI